MNPSDHREAAQWLYRGLWAWLIRWMRVPEGPPTLPAGPGQLYRSFQPARAYLSYLRFGFWLAFIIFGGALIAIGIVLLFLNPSAGIALAAPILALVLLPATLFYVAMHLRYDTMWYVITDRSMRVRRGIWIVHEVTITFENVQTVKVSQGPLQRWFGIGDVEVRTAGGGTIPTGNGGQIEGSGHHGVIEGVTNAAEIRDLILAQLRLSKTTGLGDEGRMQTVIARASTTPKGSVNVFGPEHLVVLREIRDRLKIS